MLVFGGKALKGCVYILKYDSFWLVDFVDN